MMTPQKRAYTQPGKRQATWFIARRQFLDAIRDRSTLSMTCFCLLLQTLLILLSLGSFLRGQNSPQSTQFAGTMMSFYLLYAGIVPSTPAIGIASGVFAGEKEHGTLSPILVTPVSNIALFVGKVLGAVFPAFLYSALSIVVFFIEILVFFGPATFRLLSLPLSLLIIFLIPGITFFGAALASIISSRVTTFQSAQNYSSFINTVIWFALFALIFTVNTLGIWAFAVGVTMVYVFALFLLLLAATAWKREEVMAQQ